MTVNGLTLPETFRIASASGLLRRGVEAWRLIDNRDAFGREWETELHDVYDTAEEIERRTAELPTGFEPNGVYGASLPEMAGPGAIPDVVDFHGVLCFGASFDDAPFCFDYRGGADPSVIWWADGYWRLVAPDFGCFLSLFEIPDTGPDGRA